MNKIAPFRAWLWYRLTNLTPFTSLAYLMMVPIIVSMAAAEIRGKVAHEEIRREQIQEHRRKADELENARRKADYEKNHKEADTVEAAKAEVDDFYSRKEAERLAWFKEHGVKE